ncbi:MAG: GTP pyrophosphokinase [Betaproteobacteria bacterium]
MTTPSAATGPDTQTSPPPLPELDLTPDERALVSQAWALAASVYAGQTLPTGEPLLDHAAGVARLAAGLRVGRDACIAALLFAVPIHLERAQDHLREHFGTLVADMVAQLDRLVRLRALDFGISSTSGSANEIRAGFETLRKMILAMSSDLRVVLLRLASSLQTLRWLAPRTHSLRTALAREARDVYAPLANRLGVWQFKWEIEDLALRILDPDTYHRVAGLLEGSRREREAFVAASSARLQSALAAQGIRAEVRGRPKHIQSIVGKMQNKGLEFHQLHDLRGLRVLVDTVDACYASLGVVHALWPAIEGEFDDYIASPKGNNYRSLHTAVRADDGQPMEVQIRTHAMHRDAELGVAAHWRYKEAGASVLANRDYDEKIAWLRQLLSWRDEITDHAEWARQIRHAELDDTIYVFTPQGRIIDLPRGATPIDFAYRLHSELGHRCRGARVDGQLLALNTPLRNGQQVEILTAKQGAPSRDWLNPQLAYLATAGARAKVRRFFAAEEEAATMTAGRATVMRELQRVGATRANLDELARRMDYKDANALFLAAGRGQVGPRALEIGLRLDGIPQAGPGAPEREGAAAAAHAYGALPKRAPSGQRRDPVLVSGVGKLLIQLAGCCKPVPPDTISGFVTRGHGVSIHRLDCHNFRELVRRHPERIIETAWSVATVGTDEVTTTMARAHAGDQPPDLFPVDIRVVAQDRQGLLRDISDVLAREKINVTGTQTQSRGARAYMVFTIEVAGLAQLERIMTQIAAVTGVLSAHRA